MKTRLRTTTGAAEILIVDKTIMQPPRRGILGMSHGNKETIEPTKEGTAFRYIMSHIQ